MNNTLRRVLSSQPAIVLIEGPAESSRTQSTLGKQSINIMLGDQVKSKHAF